MRLSYQWLAELVELDGVTPEELAVMLTDAGLAVDAVEPRVTGVSGVVAGQVVAFEQHPNADKLRICTVDVGQPENLTIVCGAQNVTTGMKVPVALVGASLPGGKIGKAKLRGVESMGMLCSAKEIGLESKWLPKEQTEGLYVLPANTEVGADIVQLLHLDDVVLDVDLTPNRSDCLSLRGFAYEVAALRGVHAKISIPAAPRSQGVSPASVRIDSPNCMRYEAQVLEHVAQGPSPLWMQMRLLASGVRPISLAVDITNYVMLEWGQPLHAFDFDQVHGGQIVVRQAHAGEQMVTLDGQARTLDEGMLLIADTNRAIGIAGVMGGENSETTTGTRRIILESAAFAPTSVRRTGQALGLRSEAQQRFEKGIDPEAVNAALRRATQLLADLAGAKVIGEPVYAGDAADNTVTEVAFSPHRCNRLLGTEIAEDEMRVYFKRLGFTVQPQADDTGRWTVEVPSRRLDIDIEADLVEEVGRMYGLDNIPSTLPVLATTVGVRNPSQKLRQTTRQVLIGAGLNEVFTYTFSHPKWMDALRISKDSPYRQMIPLMRPMSDERIVMRTHMLPGLAHAAAHNLAYGVSGGQIFEIGQVYWPTSLPLTEQPCERTHLAAMWFGETEADIGERTRSYDFYDAKGVVSVWLEALGLAGRVTFSPIEQSWLHPGRSAQVMLDDERLGTLGELHPETADAFDVGRAVYAEFDLDALLPYAGAEWKVARLPKFPAIRRDLALLAKQSVAAGSLLDTVRMVTAAATENLLEDVSVFDVYEGKGIPEGEHSIALALWFRHPERTLTDAEVDDTVSTVLQALASAHGAVLRS